ncbi:MAG TPA: NAD(P)-dependent oxidoreductase [Opitutales bacterium]|nr:NAD(P)-dependent oxidoreductase [Opitutales bacterium]
MNKKVGVFGLGIIGSIWARHLEADGVLAASWNRTPKPEAPKWAADPVEAARRAEVLIIVLSDPAAVQGLLERILPELGEGHFVIQSTTIDPESSERFEKKVRAKGARYLEAPFTGSKPAAEERKLVYYLGGEPEAISSAGDILELLSEVRLEIGTTAQAAALKLSMNLQIAIQAGALSESLHFARAAGISDEVFFNAMRRNAAWSGVAALKEPKLRENDFSPQFSVKHMLKDIGLLRGSGNGSTFALAAEIERALKKTAENGFAEEDFIALFKQV